MPRIVEVKDQTPLLIRPEDTVNGIVAVCRCGLSGNWPYCNGAHKATSGEDPGRLYHYDQKLPQGAAERHEMDRDAFGQLCHRGTAGHPGPGESRPQRPAPGQARETPESPAAGAPDEAPPEGPSQAI